MMITLTLPYQLILQIFISKDKVTGINVVTKIIKYFIIMYLFIFSFLFISKDKVTGINVVTKIIK